MHAPAIPTERALIQQVQAMAPAFAKRAAAAEEARRIPAESIREMLDAGLARILMPPRFGGYGFGFETWVDVIRDISKADASHGWCASLIVHHAHLVAQFPEEAQQAVWADGPDVAIAASFAPRAEAKRVDGGYRVTGDSPFASGVDNSTWLMVGAHLQEGDKPDWVFFMIPARECTIRDTWFTAGMKGTGSNTIVTKDVFVPAPRMLRLADLRPGKGPGGALHKEPLYRTPFAFYASITFAAPVLGAAQGAYEYFREWIKTRTSVDGAPIAQKASTQVGMARAAADLDAAELLLRRAAQVPGDLPLAETPGRVARSVRDFARISELCVSAIDTLITLSGTAGFASNHPIQRAWRDIHFAATHISLNTETNYSHFGRIELGLPPDPSRPFF
jgi:3-hydroxy-9,10-secoandrosta-1,3,5(10)-triene-9,17-dione monooxygenase